VYWECDTQHRFTRQEFSERLTDAPPRQSEIGKTRWEIPYVEPDEDAWRQHRATLDAHEPFRDFELARPTADGGKRYVSVSGIPVFDAAGRFAGYRGVGRHITERKRAEEEHRAHLWFLESMDRINRALQGTNDVERMMSDVLEALLDIFACDRAWLVHPCDPDAASWHAVMEHTKPEYPGAFVENIDQPVDDEIAAVFSAVRAADGAVLFGPGCPLPLPPRATERFAIRSQIAMTLDAKVGAPYLFGLHQCSRARIWTLAERRLFEEIGRRFGDALTSLSVFRSLSESERKLEAAQRVAKLGWWERDYVTQRVSLSEEVQRIFGIVPVDLPGWQDRWLDLIHPDDRPNAAAAAAAALAGTARYDVEYRVIRPDGGVRVVHSQGDVTRDESGRPLRQFGVLQDITERRRAEEELSEVKERFRVLAESSLTGIYLATEDGFVYVNPAMARMFGYAVDEIVGGLHSVDLTCPEDRPLVAENMRRRLSGEVEELRYEFRGLRKDGSIVPVEVHGRRIEHAGKIAVLGTIVDNTERRRAEDALRASEARFRTLVDHAADAFFLIDDALRVVDVNRRACESLGYSREELLGMHPRDFDAALDDPSIGRLADRARAGETITFETVHRRKDGSTFPVEIRSHTFAQGGKDFHLALVRDITDRKRAEESLRQSEAYLAEAQRLSHTGSWALDLKTNQYVYTSEESDRMWGFDPRGEKPSRQAVSERVHPEDRNRWKRNLERSLREKVDTFDEYRIVLPDGTVRHLRTIRHPVLNSAREVVKLVGTSVDITEQKGREEERETLRRLEAELAHANRLTTMGELTASIAHEVNQPLGAMVANAAACTRWLAFEPPETAKARRALESIAADGRRASEIIGRIRALVKRQAPRKDPVDVNLKIAEVIELTADEIRRNGIVLRTELSDGLPPVHGDRVQLQQVLLNLILNAIDAMGPIEDRPRELTIVSRGDGGDAVLVEVRDVGPGIDPERAAKVFEPFFTTKSDGLGIGLSISRSIVEAHGGNLWVEPNEPHGAIFRFSLPVPGGGSMT
jgi:PAS domain S-box-containing protein